MPCKVLGRQQEDARWRDECTAPVQGLAVLDNDLSTVGEGTINNAHLKKKCDPELLSKTLSLCRNSLAQSCRDLPSERCWRRACLCNGI